MEVGLDWNPEKDGHNNTSSAVEAKGAKAPNADTVKEPKKKATKKKE